MNRFFLYHISMLIIGATVAVPALISVITGGQSIPILLQAIGGCGMVGAALDGIVSKDPAEFTVDKYEVWAIILAALLVVFGTTIRLVD